MPKTATACQKYPSLDKRYVDGGYAGGCAQFLQATHGLDVGGSEMSLKGNAVDLSPVRV